jgi:hypothetical protein
VDRKSSSPHTSCTDVNARVSCFVRSRKASLHSRLCLRKDALFPSIQQLSSDKSGLTGDALVYVPLSKRCARSIAETTLFIPSGTLTSIMFT